MLHIFISVPTSLPPHPPISPSINAVRSVALSNVDGVTSHHLLQQIYGTQFLDEDIDLTLSDEQQESIATSGTKNGRDVEQNGGSDVIVNGRTIISLQEVLPYQNDHEGLIKLIKERFGAGITDIAAQELSQHLRAEAPRAVKREHKGFIMNLRTGRICYLDTPGCTPDFVLQ